MVQLDRYVTYDGDDYWCRLCDRLFGSDTALEAHCRKTTRHSWCERCERIFPSETSKTEHLRKSTSHNICLKCGHRPDFRSYHDLRKHRESTHHWCSPCNLYLDSARQLQSHDIEHHNLCVACGKFFENENNLRMHKRAHDPKVHECYGCYRKFASFSAMLIHLESGSCECGIRVHELNQIALECFQSKKYSTNLDDEYPYFCPGCQMEFATLSGLFQHAETVPVCKKHTVFPQCLSKLERFIEQRI